MKNRLESRAVKETRQKFESALRDYFSGANDAEAMLTEFVALVDRVDLSPNQRSGYKGVVTRLRRQIDAGYGIPTNKKPSTRTFESWMATSLQKKELVRKYRAAGKIVLAQKAMREAAVADGTPKKLRPRVVNPSHPSPC